MSSPVGKRLLIGALAVLLSGCGGGSTDDPPTSPVHPFLGGTQSRSDYKRDLDRYQEYRLKLERDENEDFLDVLRAAGVQPTSDDVPDSRDESDFISVGRHVVGTIESLEDGEECTAYSMPELMGRIEIQPMADGFSPAEKHAVIDAAVKAFC